MADDPTVNKLEARITELENQLKSFTTPDSLTQEEIQAYHKVSAQLGAQADWGCGINECRPILICRVCRLCTICRICRICVNECSCGPCIMGGGGGGFQGFGQ